MERKKVTERLLQEHHNRSHAKDEIIRDSELPGFGVRISALGSISFIVEARIRGKGGSAKRIVLGKYPAFSVQTARDKARQYLQELYDGQDPAKQRIVTLTVEVERESFTLSRIWEMYQGLGTLKSRTAHNYGNVLHRVYGDWMEIPISEITGSMVEVRFREHTKSMASYASRVLSGLMNYAKAIELSNGTRLLTDNPVEVLKQKRVDRHLKRRETVISPKDLKAILSLLKANIEGVEPRDDEGCLILDYKPKSRTGSRNESILSALYLIALTGCRKNEILTLRRADVKPDHFILRDTKNKRDHIVPITPVVRWVIEHQLKQNRQSPWLFPSDQKEAPVTCPEKAVRRFFVSSTAEKGCYTLHDCRRTFITVASELGIDLHSIKEMVNHKSSDVTDGYIVTRVERRLPRLMELYTKIQEEMLSLEHHPVFRDYGPEE